MFHVNSNVNYKLRVSDSKIMPLRVYPVAVFLHIKTITKP